MVLVLIDSHSKWIKAIHTASSTSSVVIEVCPEKFAQFGLPETTVTDNGTSFTSNEFEIFLQRNGIRHITTAPYHTASNGLVERAVQVVKAGLKKNKNSTFRCSYCLTPHATTGKASCELLIGSRYHSRLDLLQPNTADKVEKPLLKQKQNHDTTVKLRKFDTGDKVIVQNPLRGNKRISEVIVSSQGNVSYSVQLDAGRIQKCHVNQLRERHV